MTYFDPKSLIMLYLKNFFEIKSKKSKYNHNTLYMIGSDKVLRLVDFDFKFNQNNHHRM